MKNVLKKFLKLIINIFVSSTPGKKDLPPDDRYPLW
jgi:hypothetical protein